MMRNLLEMWPAILFGWPAILAAFAVSAWGIVRGKPWWVLVAAIPILPISLYLAGTPRFGWFGLSIPLLLAGASVAVYFKHNRVAWFLLAPYAGVFAWLAVLVINE
jgi:hypothetical protein